MPETQTDSQRHPMIRNFFLIASCCALVSCSKKLPLVGTFSVYVQVKLTTTGRGPPRSGRGAFAGSERRGHSEREASDRGCPRRSPRMPALARRGGRKKTLMPVGSGGRHRAHGWRRALARHMEKQWALVRPMDVDVFAERAVRAIVANEAISGAPCATSFDATSRRWAASKCPPRPTGHALRTASSKRVAAPRPLGRAKWRDRPAPRHPARLQLTFAALSAMGWRCRPHRVWRFVGPGSSVSGCRCSSSSRRPSS